MREGTHGRDDAVGDEDRPDQAKQGDGQRFAARDITHRLARV